MKFINIQNSQSIMSKLTKIDAEICIERHYTFNQVVTVLKKEIQTIEIDVFTDNNIISDINLIQQLTINN